MSSHDVLVTLGANNKDRSKNDLYVTSDVAIDGLLDREQFNKDVWECACGLGNISEKLKTKNYNVLSTDLCDYGYKYQDKVQDFLTCDREFAGDIITNPPYKLALPFVKHALNCVKDGSKVAMFLRIQFLEGIERQRFFADNPPHTVYVFSKRVSCCRPELDIDKVVSAMCFCWFVWVKGFKGAPQIKWI